MKRPSTARLANLIGALALTVVSAACATSRGVVAPPMVRSENPTAGPALKLVRVTDARKFQIEPSDPSIPSLKGDEIGNPAITSRAIARKRNSFGMAMGDILLDEGESVAGLVTGVVEKALRETGHRVLSAGELGYETATPIEVDVQKFWMWFSPGFWAIHMEFRGQLAIRGDVGPFAEGRQVEGYVRVGAQAATEKQWMKTLQQGLDDLRKNLVASLQTPAQ